MNEIELKSFEHNHQIAELKAITFIKPIDDLTSNFTIEVEFHNNLTYDIFVALCSQLFDHIRSKSEQYNKTLK